MWIDDYSNLSAEEVEFLKRWDYEHQFELPEPEYEWPENTEGMVFDDHPF
jgi:hypothetical protein